MTIAPRPMLFLSMLCSSTSAMVLSTPPKISTPKVSAPADFVAPEPKPLSMTRPPSEQLPGLLTGSAVLAVRIATGVFTLGWKPAILFEGDAERVGVDKGTYGFNVGSFAFRDTSPLLDDTPQRTNAGF